MDILLKLLSVYNIYQKRRTFFFKDINKLILKLIWEYKGLKVAKRNLLKKKKKRDGEVIYSDFQTYYKT